jgi:hypothetical protein
MSQQTKLTLTAVTAASVANLPNISKVAEILNKANGEIAALKIPGVVVTVDQSTFTPREKKPATPEPAPILQAASAPAQPNTEATQTPATPAWAAQA